MEFNFKKENEQDIIRTIAFALHKDGDIDIGTSNNKPLSIDEIIKIVGKTTKIVLDESFCNIKEDTSIDRRDAAYEKIRLFAKVLNVDLTDVGWRKTDYESPKSCDVVFTLKGKDSNTVYYGYYDTNEDAFVDVNEVDMSVNGKYAASDVAYWMPAPKAAGNN